MPVPPATPQRHEATWDAASGTWSVAGKSALKGDEYLWEVVVYAPTTGAIETNAVTDPYSVALTLNSERSVAIDLSDKAHKPKTWEKTKSPVIDQPVDRTIYELHIRDFSITDETVPENERGTYQAFTHPDSAGMTQLAQLADAGMNTVHLLPSFDIATIEEDRAAQAVPPCDLASFGPASPEQQACINGIRDADGFNWGYDPFHFFAPEGSYAVDPNGGARVAEFRSMVGALHKTRSAGRARRGLQPHRRVWSGRALGARPGRARLLPAPQRRRRRRDLDVLPERGDRARRRRRSSWWTRWSRGRATTRSTASAST